MLLTDIALDVTYPRCMPRVLDMVAGIMIQWNLHNYIYMYIYIYKATSKCCGLSRQVVFHDRENNIILYGMWQKNDKIDMFLVKFSRSHSTGSIVIGMQTKRQHHFSSWECTSIADGMSTQWASCQIRKIEVCACAGNAGNVFFPTTDRKEIAS